MRCKMSGRALSIMGNSVCRWCSVGLSKDNLWENVMSPGSYYFVLECSAYSYILLSCVYIFCVCACVCICVDCHRFYKIFIN